MSTKEKMEDVLISSSDEDSSSDLESESSTDLSSSSEEEDLSDPQSESSSPKHKVITEKLMENQEQRLQQQFFTEEKDKLDKTAMPTEFPMVPAEKRKAAEDVTDELEGGEHKEIRGYHEKTGLPPPKKPKIDDIRRCDDSRINSADIHNLLNTAECQDHKVVTKDDIERIRLSRFKLEKWVHAPFFYKTVIGCFVRLNIGENCSTPVYRVAKVTDVEETPESYELGDTRTNKGLRLDHGKDSRIFRLQYISNQKFSDSEFQKWKRTVLSQELPLPTPEDIKQKSKDIEEAMKFRYSKEDLQFVMRERERFENTAKFSRKSNEHLKKTRMIKEISHCETAQNARPGANFQVDNEHMFDPSVRRRRYPSLFTGRRRTIVEHETKNATFDLPAERNSERK